jgi:hypothetical protein
MPYFSVVNSIGKNFDVVAQYSAPPTRYVKVIIYHSRYREAERDVMTSTENIVPTHADASGSKRKRRLYPPFAVKSD